jgi:hypothetical protein
LQEGVYAFDVVVVVGDWGGVVGFEAGVELGGYVGHDLWWICLQDFIF